jgi:hypothetical protein
MVSTGIGTPTRMPTTITVVGTRPISSRRASAGSPSVRREPGPPAALVEAKVEEAEAVSKKAEEEEEEGKEEEE